MIEALWFCNILLFISTVLLLINSGNLVKELKAQGLVIDKVEVLEDYKPDEVTSLSAVEANKLKQESVTQAEVDTLLKPVFEKISKASEKGDGEIFLSGSDWYYNKNEKYKTARQQLEGLGYTFWVDSHSFGVKIIW